jgi:hypothetical protein
MPTLTEADLADHRVRFDSGNTAITRAAYVTTEEKHPDMLAFKDHLNRTVLLVRREAVLTVERLEPEHVAAKAPGTTESSGIATTVHYAMNPGVPGAAAGGLPQTWTLNLPAGGVA